MDRIDEIDDCVGKLYAYLCVFTTEINPQRTCVSAKSVGEDRPLDTANYTPATLSELAVSFVEPLSSRRTRIGEMGGGARPSGTGDSSDRNQFSENICLCKVCW